MDLPALLAEINALPGAADRIRLAQAIWDSIPEDGYPLNLTPEQKDELDRRLADLAELPRTRLYDLGQDQGTYPPEQATRE